MRESVKDSDKKSAPKGAWSLQRLVAYLYTVTVLLVTLPEMSVTRPVTV